LFTVDAIFNRIIEGGGLGKRGVGKIKVTKNKKLNQQRSLERYKSGVQKAFYFNVKRFFFILEARVLCSVGLALSQQRFSSLLRSLTRVRVSE